MKINRYEPLIKNILSEYPDAREDDMFLYNIVLMQTGNEDVLKISLDDFLLKYYSLDIPKLTTIIRVRQKIQANNPELQASKTVRERRRELENQFYEYARS